MDKVTTNNKDNVQGQGRAGLPVPGQGRAGLPVPGQGRTGLPVEGNVVQGRAQLALQFHRRG